MDLAIQDFDIPQEPKVATRIYIQVVELKFGESVRFKVHFFMNPDITSMNTAKVEEVLVEGDEYKEWKNDDEYIINLICSKLGLTRKEISA